MITVRLVTFMLGQNHAITLTKCNGSGVGQTKTVGENFITWSIKLYLSLVYLIGIFFIFVFVLHSYLFLYRILSSCQNVKIYTWNKQKKNERKTTENYSKSWILPLGPLIPDHDNSVLLGKVQKNSDLFSSSILKHVLGFQNHTGTLQQKHDL